MKKLGLLLFALMIFIPLAEARGIGKRMRYRLGKYWGKLNPKRTGSWARQRVMRKGYLARLIKGAARKHGAYAKLLINALKGHNAALGHCKGRWPNFRMALANLARVGRHGAGAALAGPLRESLAALRDGCPLVGKGGINKAIAALKQAVKILKGKARRGFLRKLRTAVRWMERGNIWKRQLKAMKPAKK